MITFEFSYTNAPVDTIVKVTNAIGKGEVFGLEHMKQKGHIIVFVPTKLTVIYPASRTTFLNPSPTIQVCANFEAFKAVLGMSLYRYNIFIESQKAIDLTPCNLLN